MNLTLNISSAKLAPEDLQSSIRDFCETLKSETDITAEIPVNETANSKSGGLIELGVIALTFLSSDSGKVLLEMIKDFINRESSLEIEIKKNDGSVFKVNAKNKNSKELEQIITQLQHDK